MITATVALFAPDRAEPFFFCQDCADRAEARISGSYVRPGLVEGDCQSVLHLLEDVRG